MQSLISFPSEVKVLSADITSRSAHGLGSNPIFVFYQWKSQHIQTHNGMRRFLWTANAMGSRHPAVTRGSAFSIADVAVQVSIAYKDIDRVWKQRGIDLANETLDNLVMLYAIQNQREFETEARLTFVPDL